MSEDKGLRLWPAWLILALAGAALLWVWLPEDSPVMASQPTMTLFVGILASLALSVWWLLLSRAPWSLRIGVVLSLGILAFIGSRFLELRPTGDIVPELAWRAKPTPAPLPPATAPPATEVPVAEPAEVEEAATETDPGAGADETDVPVEAEAAPEPTGPVFPQFLGPDRNATVSGTRLARDWDTAAPEVVWRQPIGTGWSGFAVSDGLALTQEQRDGIEYVVAYDFETGAARWSFRGGEGFSSTMAGDGPRATPSIAAGRVYTIGAKGILRAFELTTGRLLFETDLLADNSAGSPQWGVAASPLVLNDVVVVAAGGPGGRSLVAYDAETGERRWSGGDDPAAYSSPFVATVGGVRQIVVFNRRQLTGHDITDGSVLWRDEPLSDRPEKIAQPIVFDDGRIFVSMGYGVGSRMIRVTPDDAGGFAVERLWDSPRMKAKFTQVVYRDGFFYGLDEGVMVCLDAATGERRWKRGRYGHGQVLLVRDLLLVQSEDGELILLDPNPEELTELAHFPAVEGRVWATPTLVGNLLLVRSETEAACYRMPVLGS